MKTEGALCNLLHIVQKYEQGSGAQLQTTKSKEMWLGWWQANGAFPFGLKWVKKLRILGVYFSDGTIGSFDFCCHLILQSSEPLCRYQQPAWGVDPQVTTGGPMGLVGNL